MRRKERDIKRGREKERAKESNVVYREGTNATFFSLFFSLSPILSLADENVFEEGRKEEEKRRTAITTQSQEDSEKNRVSVSLSLPISLSFFACNSSRRR